MNLLKQIVEQDQWAELVSNSQSISEYSKTAKLEVFAFSKKEAIKKAVNVFNVPAKSLEYIRISKGQIGFMGFLKTPSQYIFSIKEHELEKLVENIDYQKNNKVAANKNGTFRIQMRATGLQLTVFPPQGLGKSVSVSDIEEELFIQDYNDIKPSLIQKALLNPNKKIIIAPYKTGHKDATISLDTNKDSMSTTLTITQPGKHGRMPEPKEIIRALNHIQVSYGIKEERIEEIIDNNLCDIPLIIAEGTPVVHGQDGKIEYYFPTSNNIHHAIRPDGSIDFKELDLIHNVRQGDVIAVLHEATNGTEGYTVTKEILHPHPGKPIKWEIGQNVILSPDQKTATAGVSGQVYLKENKILCVDPALEISSDVDLSVGNIDFLGNVIIKGNVTDGFSVVSGGNIEIHGHIGKCYIHAEGNIIAHQGIQGKDSNRIECNGDLFARFVERSNMKIGGNIIINKSLLHSHIFCEKSIYVIGDKKAIIAGGHIRAANEIVCQQLGAESYIETHIESGHSQKILNEISELQKKLGESNKKLATMKEEASLMTDRLSTAQKVKLEQMIRTQEHTVRELERTSTHKKQELHKLQKTSSISAGHSFMPGVKIKIGDITNDIKQVQNAGSLKSDDSHIIVEPYHPSEFFQQQSDARNSTKNKKRR